MKQFLYILCSVFIVFISLFSNKSIANELDKVAACTGVVMGDGSVQLRDLNNEKNFNDAFKLAMTSFYGQALSKNYSKEDLALSEKIIGSNVDKIYLQKQWTAEVYNEVIRCYRMSGLKILEKSKYIKKGSKIIEKYVSRYKSIFKRMIKAQ